MNNHKYNPNVPTYSTAKLKADRHTFEKAISLCRSAMFINVLVVSITESDDLDPDPTYHTADLFDVIRENEQAIAIIDQELARRNLKKSGQIIDKFQFVV